MPRNATSRAGASCIKQSGKMTAAIDTSAALLAAAAHPLGGGPGDYDALMQLVGDARFVLLGEATHGTHEFYLERARITRRLIREKGFTAVAVEADWPDAYRVNRYVRGEGVDADAIAALSGLRALSRLDVAKRRCRQLRRLAARA